MTYERLSRKFRSSKHNSLKYSYAFVRCDVEHQVAVLCIQRTPMSKTALRFWEGSQASPVCSDKSNVYTEMSVGPFVEWY